MFIVEKPLKFAQRILSAQQLRNECEKRLKFEAVVDKIVLSEIPKPPPRLVDNIVKLLLHAFNIRWKDLFEWEYSLQYQKTLAALDLIKFLEVNPHESIQLPTMEPRKAKLENLADNGKVRKKVFEKSRRDFQRMWLYSCPQAIKIMESITIECDAVSRMSLFHIQTGTEDLKCFVNANNAKLSEISDFLQQKWIEDVLKRKVEGFLLEAGKGWLETNVDDWYIYKQSKLPRLIGLIKQRIQIALRLLLRSSLRAFVKSMCQPCESMLTDDANIDADFDWKNDLVESRFHSPRPVFNIVLDFNGFHPVFTTDIERFHVEIVEMFKSRILITHEMPQIDPYLVTNLIFEKGLKLSTIGLLDEEIQNQILHLQKCYRVALIPMKAYAREFHRFSELKNLIVSEYVRGWRESDKTAQEMREEISHQLECIDEIERSVPSTIVIGPFQISVEAMKKSLIVKRRQIHESLLEMFIDKVKKKLETADKSFTKIFLRMTQKIENVEKLVEVRDWIPSIDEEILQIQCSIGETDEEIETLESMFIQLPDAVMATMFSCLKMPQKIAQKIVKIQAKLHFEFEQFRKLQIANEAQFQQKIEGLNDEVEACAAKHEFEDLSKIAIECDKLWGVLNEAVTHGEMLNNRQRIFNQPKIDMERLNSLIKRLHPYHTLWTMASNFLESKENWSMSPLSNVDVRIVDAEMKRCENVVQDSRLHFIDDAEMMILIDLIGAVIEAADKTFDVLRDLKHFDFQEKQWEILAKQTGARYKLLPEVNFDSLLAKGILGHAEIVNEILMEATSARKYLDLQEKLAEKNRLEDEEIKRKKRARLAARKDI